MRTIVGLVLGLAAGALFDRDFWVFTGVTGAAIGWLIGRLGRISAEIAALQKQLAEAAWVASAATPANRIAMPSPLEADPVERVAAVPVLSASADDLSAASSGSAAVPGLAPQNEADLAAIAQVAPVPSSASPVTAPAAPPNFVVQWLLGGNTVVRVAIVVLFFGVAFLLKFAYEHSHLPVEIRIIVVSLGAMALLAVGWRLRQRRPGYALSLQGGGVGLLYLTLFAAFRLYGVLPPGPAFILLVLVAAFSALLAVLQDSLALAVVGVSGGFLAPLLASTAHGSHVMLFSYYLVLNLGIVAVAWRKAWRILNLVGFGFTFVVGLFWGSRYYQPDYFASTEPFLAIFFLMYVLIPVLFARHKSARLSPYVDAALVFGVPVVAFGMQARLVHDILYGTAFSALAVGGFYLLLASLLWKRSGARARLLTESFLALGAGFATLSIPLAFDSRTTSAAWAIEGAAVVWVGLRQNRRLARAAGYCLQIAAGIAFALDFRNPVGTVPVINSLYLGCVLIALGGWFCSAYLARHAERIHPSEVTVPVIALFWGALWWIGGGVHEIDRFLEPRFGLHAGLLYLAVSAMSMSALSRALSWPVARCLAYLLLPAMILALLQEVAPSAHPFADLGYFAWPVAFALGLWILRRHEGQDPDLEAAQHPASLWLFAIVATWEVAWQIDDAVSGARVWPLIALGLVPGAILWKLGTARLERYWPVAGHVKSYVVVGAGPIALALFAWMLLVNLASDGDPAPLRYVPLLNPLDVSIGLVLVALIHWYRRLREKGFAELFSANPGALPGAAGAVAFLWINGILLRTLHHWALVPFDADAMWRSVLVQAALSILWSLTALVLMTYATWRSVRPLWLVGAVLMAVVVAKLFVVDLSNAGSVERIVSFIGVGTLMLIIGYFAPVPPRAPDKPAQAVP